MPIHGLTDAARPAFPSLGKLRKGAAKVDERKPGLDLSYFRFTSDREQIVEAFRQCYGEQPQELNVYLPYAKIEDNLSAWKEHWVAGGLKHRCDGETCVVWLQDDGTYSREPKPCPGQCKPVGRLSLILPELLTAGYVGYVTLQTHGLHDLLALQGSLLAAVEARGKEDLRGIGFVVRRVEQEISTPEIVNGKRTGKRLTRKKWLVKLQPAASWVAAQLEAARASALPQLAARVETLALTNPEWDSIDTDAEEIEDEPEPGPVFTWPDEPHNGQNTGQWWLAKAGEKRSMSTAQVTALIGDLHRYASAEAARDALDARILEATT
ncbi:MAG: hypothetical protein GX557_02745 [Chloroflexi bacterium]|nr:hypothetical protein [Chloroflexota bacterium]